MTSYTTSVPGGDPTDVTGRRIGAWIIDLLIFGVLAAVVVAGFGDFEVRTFDGFDSQEDAEAFCTLWEITNEDGACVPSETTAVTVTGQPVFLVFWLVHLIAYGVLSGVLGGSLGKLAVGLRVVTADGQKAGIGKNLLRTVLWIGDAVTCGIPVVGGILMVTSKGHRRLGDMAASTFVVDKSLVGHPLSVPGVTAPEGGYGPGYTPPSYGAPAGWDVGTPAGPPQQPGWGTGPQQPPTPNTWGTPTPGQPTPPAASPPGADSPTWDPARNAYIQYDRELGSWMQWDDATNAWKPISQ